MHMGFCTLLYPTGWVRSGKRNIPVSGVDAIAQYLYRLDGKRRFFVRARKQKAYIWQRGRFADDLSFWKKKLSSELEIEPVDDSKCLRFYIAADDDSQRFRIRS